MQRAPSHWTLLNVEVPVPWGGGGRLSFSAIWIALFSDMYRPMFVFSFSGVSNYSSFSSFIYSCSLFVRVFRIFSELSPNLGWPELAYINL